MFVYTVYINYIFFPVTTNNNHDQFLLQHFVQGHEIALPFDTLRLYIQCQGNYFCKSISQVLNDTLCGFTPMDLL